MEKKYNRRLLLVGPLPPPVGGTRISFDYLIKINKTFFDNFKKFRIIELKYKQSPFNFILQLFILLKIVLLIPFYHIVSFHANSRRVIAWGIVLKLFSVNKKIQFRLFGSDLDFYLNSAIQRKLIKYIFSNTQVLIQTKGLLKSLKSLDIKNCDIQWFPTSRNINKNSNEYHLSNKVQFVFVGHVNEHKGIYEIIKAHDILLNHSDEFNINIVGRCCSERILSLIEEKQNITFHGELDHSHVLQKLTECDIFIFPTYWSGEGYPGVIIEAMNAGMPIICTNWRFLNELVYDRINGLLIDIKNDRQLSDAMLYFMNDIEKIEQYGKASTDIVSRFDQRYWNYKFFQKQILGLL